MSRPGDVGEGNAGVAASAAARDNNNNNNNNSEAHHENENHEKVATTTTIDEQMQEVLRLMQARAVGKATNDQVEAVVDRMLDQHGIRRSQNKNDKSSKKKNNQKSSKESTVTKKKNEIDGKQQQQQQQELSHSTGSSQETSAKPAATQLPKKQQDAKVVIEGTKRGRTIEEDTENYDDDDDDDKKSGSKKEDEQVKKGEASTTETEDAKRDPSPPPPPVRRKRGRPRKHSIASQDEDDWSIYQDIPLGKQGAQMMTTFGDGKRPKPPAVRATLLGARRMLQVAIQDARYVRRQTKESFQLARDAYNVAHAISNSKTAAAKRSRKAADAVAATTNGGGGGSSSWCSSELMYRAMEGRDPLASDPPCGFDVEELRVLFPEQINAYARWSEMHHQASEKNNNNNNAAASKKQKDDDDDDDGDSKAKPKKDNDDDENDNDDDENDNDKEEDDPAKQDMDAPTGHLYERLAQFDLRTDRMKSDWYMKFSEVRQGSFLARAKAANTATSSGNDYMDDREWDRQRATMTGPKKRGRKSSKAVRQWSQLPAVTARFLHWIGFDPDSPLPPPSDDTTHALAFLAYDFFGRIVEKATFWRNLEKQKKKRKKLQQKLQQKEEENGDKNTEDDNDDDDDDSDEDAINEANVLMELDEGEQLEECDIQRAMSDPDIRPVPLSSLHHDDNTGDDPNSETATTNANANMIGPQLYFGPGFENRLEMEMEEMLLMMTASKRQSNHSSKLLSPQELKIRQEEDALFARLAKPPPSSSGSSSLPSLIPVTTSATTATTTATEKDDKEATNPPAVGTATTGSAGGGSEASEQIKGSF